MRTGNISTALKLIMFGVSVLITCVVVKISLIASDEAKAISNNAIEQMSEMNNEIMESDILIYDGNEAYGSDVINFMKKTLGDYSSSETSQVYISVKTSISTNSYTNSAYLPNIKNFTDIKYIKPTAIFLGDVVKNSNDIIIGISFVQQ